MRVKYLLLAAMAAVAMGGAAHAQTVACPAGKPLNQNRLFIGTSPASDGACPLASGDALAATTAMALAAVPQAAITWDGSALTYAVPNGPRVCVVVSQACPNLLPNAAAVVPSNSISDGSGGHVFDPITGQFMTLN